MYPKLHNLKLSFYFYQVYTDCTVCPKGFISDDFTVKVDECYPNPANVAVIVGSSVGGVVGILVIVVVVVLFVIWKSRRRGSMEDVQMTLANGANAPPPQRSSRTVPDPASLYANVDNRTILNNRPKEEPIYSEVHEDIPLADPTYINIYN